MFESLKNFFKKGEEDQSAALDMFCFQCEQTAKGEGCTKVGVCGKTPDVAALQDLLLYSLKGMSQMAVQARELGIEDQEANAFTCEALFSTLTNVNFDPERFQKLIQQTVAHRERLKTKIEESGGEVRADGGPASMEPADSLDKLIEQGRQHGIDKEAEAEADSNIYSLKQAFIYGLKGVAAYADHARILGKEDSEIYSFLHQGLADTLRQDLSVNDWLQKILECGRINLKTMELLDAAHTAKYGSRTPTQVPLGGKQGKAILVSGHDLRDLELLLQQTEGKGVNVYTHGEMLPTHGYPELKKHPHFYGHYGTAWQNQHKEFAAFPGPILMTTNCLQKPRESYKDRIFTTGLVGWPEVQHIGQDKDFSPVIDKALEMEGFPQDEDKGSVMVGFGHEAVLGLADTIVDKVKSGKIKHFFLVGGCDGASPSRNYYTEFAEQAPEDSVILTLACGKFRFFDKNLGSIDEIPRLIDVGQCNDAYSAVRIAQALADAFQVGVNDLPLSLILSWYEQKACAILYTLLYLGIKDIRLGPSLPAFVSKDVLDVLVDKFELKPISTPEEDIKAVMQ